MIAAPGKSFASSGMGVNVFVGVRDGTIIRVAVLLGVGSVGVTVFVFVTRITVAVEVNSAVSVASNGVALFTRSVTITEFDWQAHRENKVNRIIDLKTF